MNRTSGRRLLFAPLFAILLTLAASFARADQWTTPTPEELSMTSQPEVPGAAAVYLFREETTEDDLHMFSVYVRLKVLTEAGKEQGNVELKYASYTDGAGFSIRNIEGRTIHPDGTIIPFTGKPYQKLIEKTRGVKVQAKVFSMPDVEVGSIIEYRYKLGYDDQYVVPPTWFIQSDFYTRKAHYLWKPTSHDLSSNRGMINTIGWFPILPAGTELQHTELPPQSFKPAQKIFEVNAHDIPPVPTEDYMPPTSSLTYRVYFYYSTYRNLDEFWKNEGKIWSKARDKFIGPGHAVTAAVQQLVLPGDTQDQKLRKLYAAVMQLENTDFTREHTSAEEKAEGLKEIHNTDDVWERKRGNNDQLAELFIAMARAAGLKAYVMAVTNRDQNIFLKGYASFGQFDDLIAIVSVDGKEEFFDPGSRFCPYEYLHWKHTMAGGLRQTEGGTELTESPSQSYRTSTTQRIADLTMDEHGVVTGKVILNFTGAPAISWRQKSLTGDATSLEHDLRTSVESLLPQGMDVKIASIDKLADYEQPLTVNVEVKGAIGSSTGKRLLIPNDIFEANAKPAFPHEKRDIPVYFHFPYMVQDAMRIKFPANLHLESAPSADTLQFQNFALYVLSPESAPNSVTIRRNYSLGNVIFLAKEYPDLRSFYSKMETADQQSIVLTNVPVAASSSPAAN